MPAREKLPDEAIFRSNRELQAVVVDRLTPAERAVLGERVHDADTYGVLRPRGDGPHTLKIIDRDTALLFLTLAEPGTIPRFVRDALGARADRALERLVLDQVLEIERDGAFVSGPNALRSRETRATADDSLLAKLSRAALRYGEALEFDDAATLALRLYCYNRQPVSPEWTRRLATRAAVARHWGLAQRSVRAPLRRDWIRWQGDDGAWLGWSARHPGPGAAHAAFKLYVSPAREHAAEAFAAAVDAFGRGRARAFKVASDVGGLHRPDKLVAYFDDRARLQETAELLCTSLASCPAHGVPFTADAGGDGLVSWGMDPPPDGRGPGESWRFWVVGRLALALVAARRTRNAEIAPTDFALERIRLDGVDPQSWAPLAPEWAAGA